MKQSSKTIGHIAEILDIAMHFPESKDMFDLLGMYIKTGQTYILAISGGSDSMLTASLVYKYFVQQRLDLQNLILVHCNHKLRKESDQEAMFLKHFFQGTNFHIVTRKASQKAIKEESLRKWRYQVFATFAQRYHAKTLILGHNLTDRIESTFLHLLRGAHLKGFLAMSAYEPHHLFPGHVLRPLLTLAKDHILELCAKYGIPYCTDQSNFDSTSSLRNKLRIQVLAGLYALAHKTSPNQNSFQQSMLHLYKELEKTPQLKTFYLTSFTPCSLWKAKFAYEVSSTSQTRSNETTVQVLRELHITHDMSLAQIRELTKFFSTAEQGFKYLQGVYFFLAHGKRYIISAPSDFWQNTIEKSKKIAMLGQVKRYNFTLPIVQKERIGGSIRFAKSSDRYHNKTRNQYCITAKIPIFWRNCVPVVVKGEKIVHVYKEHI